MAFKDRIASIKTLAANDWAKAGDSFKQVLESKDRGALGMKCAGVAMGSVIAANGVYQFVKGANERVQNPEAEGENQLNYTRMFVGAMSLFLGAGALYHGACARFGVQAR